MVLWYGCLIWQTIYEENDGDNMLYTIITVVLNDLEKLKITMNSVLNQICNDYEYLIVDGQSNDGTTEYIREMQEKNSQIRYISERDQGIYDAMNKGIKHAQGKFVVFLGAGDTFYDEQTLENVAKYQKYDLIYGHIIYSSGPYKNQTGGAKLNQRTFLLDHHVAHQAVYVRREIIQKYPFNLKYKVEADQDQLMKIYKSRCKIKYIKNILSYYDGYGYSSNPDSKQQNMKDRLCMLKENYPILYKIRAIGHLILTGKRYESEDGAS